MPRGSWVHMGMDSKRLSRRIKQPGHDQSFMFSEQQFSACLRSFLDPKEFEVEDKPRDLSSLFPRVGGGRPFGVVPEASIVGVGSRRKLFFEVKKQGPSGNADERACKHHTVQFYKILHDKYGYNYHPFFTVFCQDLAVGVRYTSKHPYFFEKNQYFCWVNYDPLELEIWVRTLCRTHLL